MKPILDIIITVYNDADGLISTLLSLGNFKELLINQVIIVDDCSTYNNDYKLVEFFRNFYPIKIITLDKNVGPGMARQEGMKYITADYFTFIDAGDLVYDLAFFKILFKTILEHPDIYVFSCAHKNEQNDNVISHVSASHNRLLGKIFKTAFIQEYNIRFNPEQPYINEDIGFNNLCRLLCKHLYEETGIPRYLECDDALIIWIYNYDSLTRKNNHEFYFKSNQGLSKNLIFTINEAKRCGIPDRIIEPAAYEYFISIYFYYITVVNGKPELIPENIEAALYFYNNYFKKFNVKINVSLLLQLYNKCLIEWTQTPEELFFANFPQCNLLEFLLKLEALSSNKN